jgi:hypothetical protein
MYMAHKETSEEVTQRRTNQTGILIAFSIVALFVGVLIGFVGGFTSGRISENPRMRLQMHSTEQLPRGFQDRNSSDNSSSQDSWGGYL